MLTLRPATMEDAERLFAWRNDPVTRAMFIHSEAVDWPTHMAWLAGILNRPDRELFVGELNGKAVGTLRLDHGAETEISITVAPECRGRGLPRALLLAALPGHGCIAHIKRDNHLTRRLAALTGFQLVKDDDIQLWRHPGQTCTTSKKFV